MYELGTPITDEDSFIASNVSIYDNTPFKIDKTEKKKKRKEKISELDEWTYTADGDLFRKNGTIAAKRKRQVTAYSLWKQNKTDNEVSACVLIEKNTKPYAEWKCLEKDEKQVHT